MVKFKSIVGKLGRILRLTLALTTTAILGTNALAATEQVIDNGGNGTSSSGKWSVSGGLSPYGTNSLFSRESGAMYSFRFNLSSPGEYQVFARWTEWDNRRTSVPYVISHLGGSRTITVNQQQNGGKWVRLGSSWNFGATANVSIRSLGNGTTSADAIKLVPVGVNVAPVVNKIIDQTVTAGSTLSLNVTATDADGAFPVLSSTTLPGGAEFIDSNNGRGTLTWRTVSSDTGVYNITFTATDTSDPTLTGKATAKISVISSAANSKIVDNDKNGTSSTGIWNVSGGANPYGTNSLYSKANGDTYTFNVNLSAPGEYKVFARWTGWKNRRTSVPYDITHSGGTSTVTVNQQINGSQWNQLGNTWSFGTKATIRIRSKGNGTTCADAIMLVPISEGSGGSAGNTILKVNFENRATNSAYTEAQLIQDFNANRQDGAIHGPNHGARIVADPAGNTGRGKVLRTRHAAGQFGRAASFKARFSPDNANKRGSARYDDVYLSYDIYLARNTKRMPYHKLPGLITGSLLEASHASASDTPTPEGVKSFTALMQAFSMVYPNRPDGALSVNYYNAQAVQQSQFLDTNFTNGGSTNSYVLPLGEWVTIEQRIKMNTADSNNAFNSTKDLNNGLAEIWINGVKMSSKKHRWRFTNTMKADGFWFYDYYNFRPDLTSAPSSDQYSYFDNFKVSTSPITH